MEARKIIWTNIAVGLLGVFVGIDNLLRWSSDANDTKSLIIGAVCIILAAGWLLASLTGKIKQS